MSYKKILLGVFSSSLIALVSHELTKVYERNKAGKLLDEEADRYLELKKELSDVRQTWAELDKESRKRIQFLWKIL